MATDEVQRLEPQLARISEELKVLLLPKDPLDEKNVVLEIRAGIHGIALGQVNDSLQVVHERVVGLLFLESADRGERLVELLLAKKVGDQCQIGR